jgi:hypothetical protein
VEAVVSQPGVDRRETRRHRGLEEHGVVATRVRPGHHARLIDVSAGGALIETNHRLLPGASVELQMETENRQVNMRGRVLRCAVVRVRPTWVCYRGAIEFDRHLPWFVDEGGYGVPGIDCRAGRAQRADATREVV